ncbi:RNA recognition motif, partial [Trifolium medium]|nr:RNA recognition motif [Trifolium medium]
NKVDKWGKKFAFVKFREVKDEWELSQKMKDVWLGSFKLRINKSRFDRKEGVRKLKDSGNLKVMEVGVNNVQPDRSFRAALVQSSSRQEVA